MRVHHLAIAAALLLVNLGARADTYTFSFGTSTSLFSGSGVLTTGTMEATGEYPITTVSGNIEIASNTQGFAIESILQPGTFPTTANGNSFPANDNTLFAFNGVGTLSQDGLSFLLTDGTQVNLYNDGAGDGELLTPAGAASGTANLFEDVPVMITAVAPTPEPSSFALLGTGCFCVAGFLRKRFA